MRAEEFKSHKLEEVGQYNHMVNTWDFELLLMELRRSPVLKGLETHEVIIVMDRVASA